MAITNKVVGLIGAGLVALFGWALGTVWRKFIGAGLLTTAILSLYPAHDDTCIEPRKLCPRDLAMTCRAKFNQCTGGMIVVDPMNPGRVASDPNRAVLCVQEYHKVCEACGEPKFNGTYWERLRRYGPWYLGGGDKPYCRLDDAELVTFERCVDCTQPEGSMRNA